MENDKIYWVAFSLVRGIGAVRTRLLIDFFGSLKTAWEASRADWVEAGISPKLADRIQEVRSQKDLEKMDSWLGSQDIRVCTWMDAEYPLLLKEIDQPPPVLYIRGSITKQDEESFAIVGTRRVTVYGKQVAREAAEFLAGNRVTVVSGLARGVDGIAHQAALQCGGRTLAVLGCGVEQIYPPEHRKLAEEIISQGALISDYPPGTKPEAINFPPRNRIISGLSKAVLVVEAGESSGALITAGFAADQGRDVFAVPGNIYSAQSRGTNRLLEKGAIPFLDCKTLMEHVDSHNALSAVQGSSSSAGGSAASSSNEVESVILQALANGAVLHADDLAEITGLRIDKIIAALTMLELKVLVLKHSDMTYSLISVR